jgi:hypothetical protein
MEKRKGQKWSKVKSRLGHKGTKGIRKGRGGEGQRHKTNYHH